VIQVDHTINGGVQRIVDSGDRVAIDDPARTHTAKLSEGADKKPTQKTLKAQWNK
jgi:hypothetical protein